MIGLVRRVLDPSDLGATRRRAEVDPSPRGTVDLCRLLLRHGRSDEALAVARRGVRQWPRAVELRALLASAFRRTRADELRALELRLAVEDGDAAWDEMIGLFLEHEELDRAVEFARRRLAQRPGPAARVALGQALFARVARDHVPADAQEALDVLESAVEALPDDLGVRLLLADFYVHLGAPGQAMLHLYRARELEEDHPEVEERIERVSAYPLEQRELSSLIGELEVRDSAHPFGDEEGGLPASQWEGFLQRISLLEGVQRAVFCHGETVLAVVDGFARPSESATEKARVALARGFQRTARVAAKRMGIGGFTEAELDFEEGRALVVAGGPAVLFVEIEGEPTGVAEAARDFVACVVGGEIHA